MSDPNSTDDGVLLEIFRAFAESSNEQISQQTLSKLAEWTKQSVREMRIKQVFAYEGLQKKADPKVIGELRDLDLLTKDKWA